MSQPVVPPLTSPAVLAVASGKGGVGKTSLTLTLATLLARKGRRVLLLDGDTGLANLDVQLNLQPEKDLSHVLSGAATLEEIALPIPQLTFGKGTVTLLPGRAGHIGMANATLPALNKLMADVRTFAQTQAYDVVLVDVAAGIGEAQLTLCAQADSTLLVTTPDPSALTDAYALIKLLWQQHGTANTRLIVTIATAREGAYVHQRLTTATETFLKLPPLPLLGIIPACKQYATAVRQHQLVAVAYPNAPAVAAVEELLTKLNSLLSHNIHI